MRSGQYEEIDLPSIQLKRETWRGEKPGPTTAKDAKDDENPYESIEAVKAKYGSVEKSAKTNSYAEIHSEEPYEVENERTVCVYVCRVGVCPSVNPSGWSVTSNFSTILECRRVYDLV